jgi:hypothetical protein
MFNARRLSIGHNPLTGRIPRRTLIFLLTGVAFGHFSLARETRECRDDLRESDGYTIRTVTIEGRWVASIPLPIKPGDRYSNAKIQEAMHAAEQAIRSDRNQTFEFQNLGSAGILHVTRCLLVEGRQVDVIIQPRYLRVDLYRVGSNILPIPRSFLPTFYQAVPPGLLAFNPTFGAYQDERYGFAPTFGMWTSLLDVPELLKGAAPSARDLRLELIATGRKSLENSFYQSNADLSLARQRPGEFIRNLAIETNYAGKEEPRGDENFSRQAFEFGGSLLLKPETKFVQTVLIGGKYRWSMNSFADNGSEKNMNENAFEARMIAEGRIAGGFLRGALWADAASPEKDGAYERLAGIVGFEKEFAIAPNQAVGVEAIAGAGRAWGAPQYARFYGGNSDRNFLYDSLNSPSAAFFPTGPWIRSFGEGQALASRSQNSQGATSYWNVNLNITFPIPGLSHPLIPDEEVADGVTLKQLLKNKAGDSVSFYAAQLASEGLAREEALAKARATYGEVKPAVEFIADQANVYSVKPLIMCDLADLDAPGGAHKVRVAVGGGLQITIVTAKLEVGYMHTAIGKPGDQSGNFLVRLVFQNIF